MNKLQLAVAVKEKEYLRRLADYIRGSVYAARWQITAFTSVNSCKQYMKQGFSIDIIVAEREFAEELRHSAQGVQVVLLSDRPASGEGELELKLELYRYQALPQLMNALERIYIDGAGIERSVSLAPNGLRGLAGTERTLVAAVHSAAGGVGKTTVALHLAAAAGAAGMRACYVNLECWDTTRVWFGDGRREEAGAGLSDLLYLVKSGNAVTREQLKSSRRYNAVLKCDYMPGFANPEDRLTLGGEDYVGLAAAISSSGGYDLLVLDMDAGWSEAEVSLLRKVDLVYEVVRNDRSVIDKQRQAMSYFRQDSEGRCGDLWKRCLLVCNGGSRAVEADAFGGMTGLLKESSAWLPEVPEWRSQGCSPLASSSYLAAASLLVKRFMSEGDRRRAAG
ncbi:hypothetical protein [Paenibacillus sp. PAMC21692]|uniref:hypothetical protein n=1 Tax=Paenibacillus sp. PAMC21692 TaxID=2762320 RepID=UPI00164DD42B|nr:hypothetical protein [Paenibacillus sp. PAMC21692]QNK59695.1 hypothetical protein H7F31_13050 [Paenibacillus sp. PAMC21692]